MNKELIKLIYNKYDTITLHPYTLEDLKPHPLYFFLYFSQNNIDD